MELDPRFDDDLRVPLGGWKNPHTQHVFRAVHFLAEGGNSDNFVVKTSEGRLVALKRCHFNGDLSKTGEFFDEDCNLRTFQSPHIIRMLESWLVPGQLEGSGEGFFITEYIRGGSLESYVRSYFTEQKLYAVIAHVGLALEVLHCAPGSMFIHRYNSFALTNCCLTCYQCRLVALENIWPCRYFSLASLNQLSAFMNCYLSYCRSLLPALEVSDLANTFPWHLLTSFQQKDIQHDLWRTTKLCLDKLAALRVRFIFFRDVKHGNLLMTPYGPILADLAGVIMDGKGLVHKHGTNDYMPPETLAWLGYGNVSPVWRMTEGKGDIYALG